MSFVGCVCAVVGEEVESRRLDGGATDLGEAGCL